MLIIYNLFRIKIILTKHLEHSISKPHLDKNSYYSVMKYFLSIDQGTTSTRSILFNSDGTVANSHQIDITQYFPDNNSVEHDPKEIIDFFRVMFN